MHQVELNCRQSFLLYVYHVYKFSSFPPLLLGQLWLKREDILGRARGTLRYLGMVTIILNDYPALKYVLIGIMGLFVLTNKES